MVREFRTREIILGKFSGFFLVLHIRDQAVESLGDLMESRCVVTLECHAWVAPHATVACGTRAARGATAAYGAIAPHAIETTLRHSPIIFRNLIMKPIVLDVTKTEPRLLDLNGAAAYLGISRSAVRLLVDRGQVRRIHLPGLADSHIRLNRFLLDKADLDVIIERSKAGQSEETEANNEK